MNDILLETFSGGFRSIWTIAKIVIPLMIILQLARDFKVMDVLAKKVEPMTRLVGMSGKTAFPLFVGLIFGLSFGAGAIIESSREGDLDNKDLILLVVFLIACHGVLEDTLILVAIGANGWILLGTRLILALVLTWFLSLRLNRSEGPDLKAAAIRVRPPR